MRSNCNEAATMDVGIDVGSTSTNAVVVESGVIVWEAPYRRHSGHLVESVKRVLSDIYSRFSGISSVSFTGMNGRALAEKLGAPFHWDALAQYEGAVRLHPDARAVIAFGGQDCAYLLLEDGELADSSRNSECAAGTGSFLEAQAQRNFHSEIRQKSRELDEAARDAALAMFIDSGSRSKAPAKVAAKCTVFAKTDMIHLANNNVPQEDIFAGLVRGLVRTIVADVIEPRPMPDGKTLLIGGGSLNSLLYGAFREYFPGLIIPDHATSVQAYGAAMLSKGRGRMIPVSSLASLVLDTEIKRAPALQYRGRASTLAPVPKEAREAYLGLDIGSTTTKCALLHFTGSNRPVLMHKEYIKTEGRPIRALQKLLKTIISKYQDGIEIKGVAATGSGRMVAGYFLGADAIIDEITAHALAAVQHDRNVDTVFELGGQDSKYIWLDAGYPKDFAMNKICSAGTGSFLEEMAEKLGIDIVREFESLALKAKKPVALGERCTVFMESDAMSALQKGATLDEVCAGLALAVGHNYINRVVEQRRYGSRIMFLGGPSQNRAVVAALAQITGSEIIVPQDSEVFGAIGAALYSRMHGEKTSFRGLQVVDEELQHRELSCRKCANECTLQQYTIPGKNPGSIVKVVFGGVCGEYETGPPGVSIAENYFLRQQETLKSHLETKVKRKTKILLLNHLHMHQYAVLWTHFFDRLGFQPVWDAETNKEMVDIGTRKTSNTFCFSKAVSVGHIGYALQNLPKNTLLFLPSMIDMQAPEGEPGLFCPVAQGSYYTAKATFSIQERHVVSPVVHMNRSEQKIAFEFYRQLHDRLGVSKRGVADALHYGLRKQAAYQAELAKTWRQEIKPLVDKNMGMVAVARPYLLCDKRLNLNIGSEVAKLGIPVLPMDFLPCDYSGLDGYDNMYWGSGARRLRAAKFIKEHPNLYMITVTNFGCGSDSFILKYLDHEMNLGQRKPYLELELDAHSARAGMITRLEAYKNVIRAHHGDAVW